MERFNEMQQWVLARRDLGPIGRHALYVLELTDALDMTVDTFLCGLLHGETDTSGYPAYNAIVGGLAFGVLDAFAAGRFQGYSDLVTFVAFAAVVIVRPTGIFGESTVNRA